MDIYPLAYAKRGDYGTSFQCIQCGRPHPAVDENRLVMMMKHLAKLDLTYANQ